MVIGTSFGVWDCPEARSFRIVSSPVNQESIRTATEADIRTATSRRTRATPSHVPLVEPPDVCIVFFRVIIVVGLF